MRRFEFNDGTSNKYWEIGVTQCALTVHYGRSGTRGQTKTTTCTSPAEAQKKADKLIAQKLENGYLEMGGAPETAPIRQPPEPGPGMTASGVPFSITAASLPDSERKALNEAMREGRIDDVKRMLAAGASIENLSSALTYAAKPDHRELCELFVEIGAVGSITPAARLAAQEGRVALVNFFLDNGADINHLDDGWRSILSSAAYHGRIAVVELLFSRGAMSTMVTANALRMAAVNDQRDAISCLLRHGVNINAVNEKAQGVMYAAAGNGIVELIRWLHEQGADLGGKKGKEAFLRAVNNRHEPAAQLFIELGVELNKTTAKQALAAAGESGMPKLIAELGARGWVTNENAAQRFVECFGVLCRTDEDRILLNGLAGVIKSVMGEADAPVFRFPDGRDVSCESPYRGPFRDDVPASYNAIAGRFNGVTWEAGGPDMGYPGLDSAGVPRSDVGDAVHELANTDPDSHAALSKLGFEGAFLCGQNWLLFDPSRTLTNGERALAFISHESCTWEQVESADGLDYGQIFLRLLADSFLGLDSFPEVYC